MSASSGAGRVAVGGSLWEPKKQQQQVGFWAHVIQFDEALGVSVVPDSEMPAPYSLAASADQFHVGTSTLPDGHPAHTFLVRSRSSVEPRLWHVRRDSAREMPLSSAMRDALSYANAPEVRIVPVVSTADDRLALVFRPVPNQLDHMAFSAHGDSGRIGESMIRKYPSGVAYGAAEDSSGRLAIVVAPGGRPACDAMWVERERLTTFPVLEGDECDALGSNWGQRLSLRAMDGEPGQFRLNATRCGYFSPNARVWYYDLQRGEGGSVSATLRLTLGQDGNVVGAVGEGAKGDR
ncbi:MAG: hypothetical protein GC161_07800 [Planctomycetaceae bacterium]|nr:hypothetical protein [Planctomycetaceae bacterium]